ncbi:MAG: phage tail protein [Pararhodobacter sp.]|nr:phage tail protein [Pararhodobacter sp.]
MLRFRLRDGRALGVIEPGALVARESGGAVALARASGPETAARVRLSFLDAEGDFETLSAEAVHPDDRRAGEVTSGELPLSLTRGEARLTVKRWLAEARVARDSARFALPPSAPWGAGDVVALDTGAGGELYRIDRIELTGAREVEAVRVEPGIYTGADLEDDAMPQRAHRAPAPVAPLFLDLPLMRGDEVPHAPHLAVTAQPWPGAVAVYDAPAEGGDFALNRLIASRAAIGVSLNALGRAQPGLWQRGAGLELALAGPGGLAPASRRAVLDGANLLAIGNGAEWELLQFAEAQMIGPDAWRIGMLLRGQFGSDAVMAQAWPPGSLVVRIDAALAQIDLAPALRQIARRYRIGPAAQPFDDITYVERMEAFRGIGLRPYAPVHLRHEWPGPGAALTLRWVRRTRIGGDAWEGAEVPLGEESERYLVRVIQGAEVLREEEVSAPQWSYDSAAMAGDGVSPPFTLAVAQISASFGPGGFASLTVPA